MPLYINTTRPTEGRVNLKELQEVREHHMPAAAVRFAKPCQLQRVVTETSLQHPHLREEVTFVMYEELGRRRMLATTPMQVSEGGRRNG